MPSAWSTAPSDSSALPSKCVNVFIWGGASDHMEDWDKTIITTAIPSSTACLPLAQDAYENLLDEVLGCGPDVSKDGPVSLSFPQPDEIRESWRVLDEVLRYLDDVRSDPAVMTPSDADRLRENPDIPRIHLYRVGSGGPVVDGRS